MNYKLIGQRNLRKYTAPKMSPTYAAAVDAQLIVDALCGVPWGKVTEKDATMTYHTEESVGEVNGEAVGGLDMNVIIRDQFDAALFCAGHAGGQHRAYANAAVYHYVLPDGTLPKLTRLVAKVTSDPYNAAGARIAILTNETGIIPTNCNDCRTGDAHADGVAPRTVASNGNWLPTMADCIFSADPENGEAALPSGGLQLKKHLFVFVLMESYSTVRGNWIEGCSFIRNLIEIETDDAVDGWTDGSTYDLSPVVPPVELDIVGDGVLPDVTGDVSGAVSFMLTAGGTMFAVGEGGFVDNFAGVADELSPVNSIQGVRGAYARIGLGDFEACPVDEALVSRKRNGVGFCVKQFSGVELESRGGAKANPRILSVAASVMVVPFSVPCSMKPSAVRMDWSAWLEEHTPSEGTVFNLWINRGNYVTGYDLAVLKNRAIYDATSRIVGDWELVGTVPASEGSAQFAVDGLDSSIGSFMLTAYVPQENIAVGTTGFVAGTGDFHYDGLSLPSKFGVDASAFPDFEADTRYEKFACVVADQPASRGEVIAAPDGANVTAIIERDGFYVIGTNKGFYWSEDFVHWNGSNVNAAATKIIWTGAAFAAVSSAGIYCSADGKVWTRAVSGNAMDIIVFGDKVVAVVIDRAPYHAPLDCSEWVQASSAGYGKYWNCLGVIGGKVVAGTGDVGSLTRCDGVFYSSDADTWSAATFTPGETLAVTSFSSVIKRNGYSDMIIAVSYRANTQGGTGVYFISTDGVTWTKKTGSAQMGSNVIYDSGLLIFEGEATFVSSDFGTTFTKVEEPYGKVAKVGGLYCVCNSYEGGGVFFSKDAINWVRSAADASVIGNTSSFISFGGNGKIFKYQNDLDMKRLPCFAINAIEPEESRLGEYWTYHFFNQAEWDFISEFPTGRFSGRGTLCVPDLTLIG